MGQISRMNRADRFIKAFGDMAASLMADSLSVGQQPTVTGVELSTEEGHGEEVRVVIRLQDEKGNQHALLGDELFDPEYTDMDHAQIEFWADQFGLPYEEVQQRLKQANLVE